MGKAQAIYGKWCPTKSVNCPPSCEGVSAVTGVVAMTIGGILEGAQAHASGIGQRSLRWSNRPSQGTETSMKMGVERGGALLGQRRSRKGRFRAHSGLRLFRGQRGRSLYHHACPHSVHESCLVSTRDGITVATSPESRRTRRLAELGGL